MIRILVLIDTSVGARSGAEQHLKALLERLDYGRFAVDVVQMGPAVPQPEGRIAGARLLHLPTGKLASWAGLRRAAQILGLMRRERYDCVLSFFESADILSAVLAPRAGVRTRISSRRDTGFRHSWRLKLWYRLLNGRFAGVIAASEAIRRSLVAEGWPPERIRLIHNGVDSRRFDLADGAGVRRELGIPKDAVVLGTVANLTPVKDHATLVEALRRLHLDGRKLYLVLAGEGPLRADLTRQVAEAGLADFVHFLGQREDIPEVLAAVDMFVLVSRTEGLSNALLEASAAGRPIVATDVGGNPEVVEDGRTGLLVPPGEPGAVAEAAGRLAAAPDLRVAMGAAGRERVRRLFSPEVMVQAYVRTIEETLEEAGGAAGGGGGDDGSFTRVTNEAGSGGLRPGRSSADRAEGHEVRPCG